MERCKYVLIAIFMLCLTSITMAQQIGGYRVADDYDYSAKPIDITVDGASLLAVGQTGLFIIDTTQIPEPSTLSLLLFGTLGLVRQRRQCNLGST